MRISDWSSDVCSSDLVVRNCWSPIASTPPRGGVASASPVLFVRWVITLLRCYRRRTSGFRGIFEQTITNPRLWGSLQVKAIVTKKLDAAGQIGREKGNIVSRHRDTIISELLKCTHHVHCVLQRSEEHTSELQSLMRISYAVFCLKK